MRGYGRIGKPAEAALMLLLRCCTNSVLRMEIATVAEYYSGAGQVTSTLHLQPDNQQQATLLYWHGLRRGSHSHMCSGRLCRIDALRSGSLRAWGLFCSALEELRWRRSQLHWYRYGVRLGEYPGTSTSLTTRPRLAAHQNRRSPRHTRSLPLAGRKLATDVEALSGTTSSKSRCTSPTTSCPSHREPTSRTNQATVQAPERRQPPPRKYRTSPT